MSTSSKQLKAVDTAIGILSTKMDRAIEDIKALREDIRDNYATKASLENLEKSIYARYDLARSLVFSTAGLILTSVISALIYLVVKK